MPVTITSDSGNFGAMFTPKIYASSDMRLLTGNIAFDTSYATGGESMPLSVFFRQILGVMFTSRDGYSFEYDYALQRVMVYELTRVFPVVVDPPSIAADSTANVIVTAIGVATNDRIVALPSTVLENGLVEKGAWASAANQITIRLQNTLATAVDGAPISWEFLAIRPQAREVLAGTNLATLTGVRFMAWGY